MSTDNQFSAEGCIYQPGVMSVSQYNVLFLGTGNSVRSIRAEAILNQKGKPNFTAYSGGSHPVGTIHPETLRQLEMAQLPTDSLRSKDWAEFAKLGAPEIHFGFTICDDVEKLCPVWPGVPMTAHRGVPDPTIVAGTDGEIQRAFRDCFMLLERRISLFLCLPLQSLDKLTIKNEIDRIGKEGSQSSHRSASA